MNQLLSDWRESAPGLRFMAQEYLRAQNWEMAAAALEDLARLAPEDAWCQQWRVVTALALNRPQQAVDAAQAALQLLPPEQRAAKADVLFNMGQAYTLMGQAACALDVYNQSLTHNKDNSPALLGMAKAKAQMGEYAAASQLAAEVLQLEPNNLEALWLVANGLYNSGAHVEALERFLQYEHLKPASPFIACMVVFLMRALADWNEPDLPANVQEKRMLQAAARMGERKDLTLLAHRAGQGMPALEPFSALVLYDNPALQKHTAGMYLRHMHPAAEGQHVFKARLTAGRHEPGPLKLAYVSNEFNEHATSYLLAGVLDRHRGARVKVYLLSFAPMGADGYADAMQRRIQGMGHTWLDIHGWSDSAVVEWCRLEGIEVAVDLKGLTRGSRPGIFAQRAAPVQVNWLGYPGTLDAPYYDYVIADAQVLPAELEPHFGERVWRMPHCYQPNDPDRLVDPAPQHRSAHGLPKTGPVLVCFNNIFKITPEVWAVWMRLLRARPDAVLWLMDDSARARLNLCANAQEWGIEPHRLVFAPRMPQAQHLARLALADLSLDTLPCNAHTTASDALWAGVPHIACTGNSFAARVGLSVLTAAGMSDLATNGLAAYEEVALRLVLDDELRAAVRDRLAQQRLTAPLWDATAFAHALEGAFEEMLRAARVRA